MFIMFLFAPKSHSDVLGRLWNWLEIFTLRLFILKSWQYIRHSYCKLAAYPHFHYTDVTTSVNGVSNHQPNDCLLNRLFGRRSNKTSKLRVTGLCAGNSPATGEFPAQMASNTEMFPFDDVIVFVCGDKITTVLKPHQFLFAYGMIGWFRLLMLLRIPPAIRWPW